MKNIHPIFQRALVPLAPIDVDAIKCGLPATNDGELTQADLDAIDAQFLQADLDDILDPWKGRRRREEEAGLRELDALRREGKL